MARTKQRLSKLKKEADRLFRLEEGIQRSAAFLTLFALAGILYLLLPVSGSSAFLANNHIFLLGSLFAFLAVNLVQQGVLMRLRKKWRELEDQSTHDGLTGAFNREAFEDVLDEEMSRAKRYQFPLSLCIVDLDNFKTYNDTYGHPMGDRLLSGFASRVQSAIRNTDCLARYGGDEFCILLPHTDLMSAEKFLSRILPEVQEWLDFTFSAGVTAYRPAEDKISFITRADTALYQAKREGRNQIRCLIGDTDEPVLLKPGEPAPSSLPGR